MKHTLAAAFLTKRASTAMTRYLAGDATGGRAQRLGPQLQKAMLTGQIRSREATIKSLGRGGTQQADLVMSPQFGVAVRKYRYGSYPDSNSTPLHRELGERRYKHFTAYLGEKSRVGHNAPAHYWEPSFGPETNIGKRTAEQHKALIGRLDARALNGSAPRKLRVEARAKLEQWAKARGDSDQLDSAWNRRLRRAGDASVAAKDKWDPRKSSPEIAADVSAIEQRLGRKMWDHTARRNIIGGRVVDADLVRQGTDFVHGIAGRDEIKEHLGNTFKTFNNADNVWVTPVGRELGAKGRMMPPLSAEKPPPKPIRPIPELPPQPSAAKPESPPPRIRMVFGTQSEPAASAAPAPSAAPSASRVPWGGVAAGVGAAAAAYGGYRLWKHHRDRKNKMRKTADAFFKQAAERLKGGRGDSRPDSAFAAAALRAGRKVEREHTKDPALTKEIAKDHLTEDPAYYRKLRRMEAS